MHTERCTQKDGIHGFISVAIVDFVGYKVLIWGTRTGNPVMPKPMADKCRSRTPDDSRWGLRAADSWRSVGP
jgi:hypothetical protein